MSNAAELLDQAIEAMSKFHAQLLPNDEFAEVPAAAIREFVDTHARLMFERRQLGLPLQQEGQHGVMSPCNDAFLAWIDKLPKPVRANVLESTKRGESYTYMAWIAAWDSAQRSEQQEGQHNVAPIASVEIKGGEVFSMVIYAPGLPDGVHELFPAPLATPGDRNELQRIIADQIWGGPPISNTVPMPSMIWVPCSSGGLWQCDRKDCGVSYCSPPWGRDAAALDHRGKCKAVNPPAVDGEGNDCHGVSVRP